MSAVSERHRVVIIGSGFGGLFAAKKLRRANVDITLISATTTHLFQPLLYQVATGILSTGEVAPATREILKWQRNTSVLLGTVTRINVAERWVESSVLGQTTRTAYDSLIVATGVSQSYFGNDHFAQFAPGMKTIDDALELRGRIFTAFELAELAPTTDEQRRLTTFVVVGAGPTGVEMAGQIVELSRRTLRGEYRRNDPATCRVFLLDAAPRMLPAFGQRLAEKARNHLEHMGVEVRLGAKVVNVDARGIDVLDSEGQQYRIECTVKVWAAGVQGNPLAKQLAEQTGVQLDRVGRVMVEPDLSLPGHPEVFVVGDLVSMPGLPGVAAAAIQAGRFAAKTIKARATGKNRSGGQDGAVGKDQAGAQFRYRDKGSMATLSRFGAIAVIGKWRFSGFFAWFLWLFVHLLFITGFKNRLSTLFHWFISFLGRGRAERGSTERMTVGRLAIEKLGDDFRPTLGGEM